MDAAGAPAETHAFQAEVAELLNLMVHSVYSETDIFLRELISNASDACDKLRYEAIAKPELLAGADKLAIRLMPDKTAGTLTIADTGIGMDRQELIDNLGTVARSGTRAFLKGLAEAKEGASLIGQFGVGFYAAFMVADRIEVTSRRAGSTEAWVWTSSGGAGLRAGAGQRRAGQARAARHRGPCCISRTTPSATSSRSSSSAWCGPTPTTSSFRSSFWTTRARPARSMPPARCGSGRSPRSSRRTTPRPIARSPWPSTSPRSRCTTRWRAGSPTPCCCSCPRRRPSTSADPNRKGRIKLYVRRVFITDDADLLPPWLRFVRGVVDSEDLPLNISREMLQNNPQVTQIRNGLVSRVIGELESTADKDAETYGKIWNAFGPVLKEGLYEDQERRGQLLALARFATTAGEGGLRSLKQYVADLKPNQTEIYYLVGESAERVKSNPKLEAARARGIEVLLLTDPIDAFWTMMPQEFEGKPLKSLSQGDVDFGAGAAARPGGRAEGRDPTRTPASSRRSRTRWPTRSRRCAPRSG